MLGTEYLHHNRIETLDEINWPCYSTPVTVYRQMKYLPMYLEYLHSGVTRLRPDIAGFRLM